MYIPPYYKEEDKPKLLEFMKANSFTVLVSSDNNFPRATHLPFVMEEKNNEIILTSHMAKANPQWKEFNDNELLVIFQGPHAYVSPSNYEKQQNVPTWNYVAVHAYGKAKILSSEEENIKVLEAMISQYEEGYFSQWKNLSQDYVKNMIKAIVSFEIKVSKLEGKYKLSQNKTKNEQQNIISSFEKSEDSLVSGVAKLMKKNL